MGEHIENRNCERAVRELLAAYHQFKLRNADPEAERDYLRKQLSRMTELISVMHRRISQLEAALSDARTAEEDMPPGLTALR